MKYVTVFIASLTVEELVECLQYIPKPYHLVNTSGIS